MAQLKDLLVSGPSRLIGKLFANEVQLTTLNIPTTSNGTTYGPGTNNYVPVSNGTSIYWSSAAPNATTAAKLGSNAGSATQPIYFANGVPTAITGNIANGTIGNAATATAFSSNATVTLTGDATGTSAGSTKSWSVPVTLANSGATAGSYGNDGNVSPSAGGTFLVPYVTVDAKGRVTAISNKTITLPTASSSASTVTTAEDTTNTLYVVGVTSSATTTLKRDTSVTVTGGTLTATTLSSNGVNANVANSNSAGGLSLYSTTPTSYGIAMRAGAAHGWITAAQSNANIAAAQGISTSDATGIDWAINFYNTGSKLRGFKFLHAGSSIASLNGYGYMQVNRLGLNRVGGTKFGRLYWYNAAYYTWVDYMSDSSAGNAPNGGQPAQLGNVTSWAKRSLIENSSGYGWVWEAASNTAIATTANTTQPTVRMALSSNTGYLRLAPNASSDTCQTGGLIIDSSKNGSSGNVAIELWRGNNASWQIANNSGTLHFKDNYTTAAQTTYTSKFSIAYNTGTVTARAIQPEANNTYALGTSSLKWSNVYATTFTGSLSGNASTASKLGTSTVGSARQPIYLNGGTATAANYTVAHLGNAGKSNMNDVGRLHASMGMTNLSNPSNTTDNPGLTGDQTGWHHYIDINYSDDPNGSNSWVTQFANKAGTTDLWMRSRNGSTITNGTAWTAPWVRVLTESNINEGIFSGMNLLPQTQTMENWGGTENRSDTPFDWCYSHTQILPTDSTSSYIDNGFYNSVITPEPNTYYTLSFWAKASAATNVSSYFYANAPISGYNSSGNTTTASDGSIVSSLTTSWKRYWVVWKTRSDVSGAKNIITARITTKGVTVYIALPKLEKGRVATDWSPNPKDGLHLYGRTGNSSVIYNGGGGTANDYHLVLHGNSTNGSSGIAFLSSKGNTAINYPSDRAFIQYHPYGVTAAAEGSAPTLATSGEAGRFVIGVGNDATDQIWLQTPGRTGLIHQVGATSYVIPDTGNTTGNVGGSTQPVYVNGGVITACTSYANATVGTASKLGSSTLGSATKPIYLSSGSPAECSTYAGGTAVTLNNASKAASTASFYAPTTGGTQNTQALVGNGATAAPKWVDISPSSAWTAGTTSGPVLKITVLGQTQATGATIPSASATASGVVTTGAQQFVGRKTFGYMTRKAVNDSNEAVQWVGDTYLVNGAGTAVGEYWYNCGNATNITTGQYSWRQYSPNSTANTSTTGKYETYSLPAVATGLTENKSYSILTTKSTVSVAQGGTGSSTAAGARTNLGLGDLATINKPSSNQTTTFLRGDGTWQAANNYSLPLAANGTRGGVQIGYTTSGQNYAVQLSSEKMYVNVPWTDTKVTQSASTASNWRKILLHYKDDATSTTAVTTSTNQVYAAVGISAQASTGTIRANSYKVTDSGTITYNTSNGCVEIIC